jgi:hypothetical protein
MSDPKLRVFLEGVYGNLTEAERAPIREAFADAGVSGVEAESPKMHRQATLEWVVIVASLSPFFHAILEKAGEDAYEALKRLIARLRSSGKSGERIVELHDPVTKLEVDLRSPLPEEAWRALVAVDLSGLREVKRGLISGPGEPREWPERETLEWNGRTRHWLVYPQTLIFSGRRIGRRIPIAAAREPIAEAGVLARVESPWKRLSKHFSETSTSISAQRARFVAYFSAGNKSADVARQTLSSDELVLGVLDDFSRDGFRALEPDYEGSRGSSRITLAQHEEIIRIARGGPQAYGKQRRTWSLSQLTDFLVAEGVIEDISQPDVNRLLNRESIHLGS